MNSLKRRLINLIEVGKSTSNTYPESLGGGTFLPFPPEFAFNGSLQCEAYSERACVKDAVW